jgi:hypothetical protein
VVVPEHPQDDRLALDAGNPRAWQSAAHQYALAANYLLDWYDGSRATPGASKFTLAFGGIAPIMVLYAIAAENLLKAIRVAIEGSPVVNGALSRHFKHHDLLSHADRAGVSLADGETDLLERLRDFVEAGRYPVASAAGKTPRAWRFEYPRDIEAVWSLLEHLERALCATTPAVLPRFNFRARYRPPGYALASVPRRRPTRG